MDAKLYINDSRTASHIISNSPQINIRALCIDIDGFLKINLSEQNRIILLILYDSYICCIIAILIPFNYVDPNHINTSFRNFKFHRKVFVINEKIGR